jgi:hypothetical protein
MPGIIKLDQLRSRSGDNGLRFNSTTKNVEFIGPGDFYFNIEGETFTPMNKQFVGFYFNFGVGGTYDQSWVVPTGVTHVYAKLWGAGGGGGCQGGWNHGGEGGGGGHARGIIPVTAGQTLSIRVPRGGYNQPGTTNAPYGGGSSTAGGDNQYGAGGGGYAGIFIGTTPYLIAGGGGGGGSTTSGGMNYNQRGGAGGGITGQHGISGDSFTYGGGGGTQSAGGSAGSGSSTAGGAGSSLTGGSVQGNPYGGGGGGGYYGGGSGAYTGSTMGGGGGGSGYVHSSVLLGATFTGSNQMPAMYHDADLPKYKSTYMCEFAVGADFCNSGGDGFVCIYY